MIYYLDESLIKYNTLIKEFFEEFITLEYRWADPEEYKGLTCITAHDIAMTTKQKYKFKNINSESLINIIHAELFIYKKIAQIPYKDLLELTYMAISGDAHTSYLAKQVLLQQYVLYLKCPSYNNWFSEFAVALRYIMDHTVSPNNLFMEVFIKIIFAKPANRLQFIEMFRCTHQHGFYKIITDKYFPNICFKEMYILNEKNKQI